MSATSLPAPLFDLFLAGQHRARRQQCMRRAHNLPDYKCFWVQEARRSQREMLRLLRNARAFISAERSGTSHG